MKKQLLVTIVALTVWASSTLAQTTIFSDDFSDGNSNGWFNTATQTSVAAKVIDGALVISAGRGVQTFYSKTTLAVGESLSLNFDAKFTNPDTTGSLFNIGLFDSNGSAPITADGSTGYRNFLGIMATINPAPTTSAAQVRFWSRKADTSDILMSSVSYFTQIGTIGG